MKNRIGVLSVAIVVALLFAVSMHARAVLSQNQSTARLGAATPEPSKQEADGGGVQLVCEIGHFENNSSWPTLFAQDNLSTAWRHALYEQFDSSRVVTPTMSVLERHDAGHISAITETGPELENVHSNAARRGERLLLQGAIENVYVTREPRVEVSEVLPAPLAVQMAVAVEVVREDTGERLTTFLISGISKDTSGSESPLLSVEGIASSESALMTHACDDACRQCVERISDLIQRGSMASTH